MSVDRIKIIQFPENNNAILGTIEYLFKQKYAELLDNHVKKYNLNNATKNILENLSFMSYDFYSSEETSFRRPLRI